MTNFNFLSNPVAKNEVNRALAAENALQNAGGGTSRHKALIIAKQFSQYCVSRSEGAQGKNLDEKAQLSPSCVEEALLGGGRFSRFVGRLLLARFLWYKKEEVTVSKESRSGAQGSMTLAKQPTNHPLITPLSPRNHPLLSRKWQHVACMLMVLFVCVGNVWGVKSTFTKGEAIFIYQQTTNSAWRDNADVKAWFKDKDSESGGEAVYTNWLCDGDNSYKVWYVIVPQASLNQVRIQRFEPNTSNCWTGNEFSANQSDRGNDDYNVLWSENSSGGWKNETFGFTLKGSPNSWSGNLATFEDMGDGYFQCTYTYTPTNTQDEFKIYDSWGHAYGRLTDGNNFLLQGLKAGQECTILASFKIQDCSSANRTSLNIMFIHEPGVYTSASGYNTELSTYDSRKYEWYGVWKSGSDNKIEAGETGVNESGAKLVAGFSNSTEKHAGWVYVKSAASTSGDVSATNVFPKLNNAFQVDNSTFLYLCVKGYDQFQIVATDNNGDRSKNKYLKVLVDGKDVTAEASASKTATVRAYSLTASEPHLIGLQTTSTDKSTIWGFSLRPAAPSITATSMAGQTYSQGATATAMTVTATPVVAGHTLTYTWYSNTSASMTGATEVQSSTSNSYTPSTAEAGGLYYVCVVSEEGCNTATTDWSGLITVNASCTTLGAVNGLVANDVSQTELQFAWAAFGATATKVVVSLYSDEDCTALVTTVDKENSANVHRFTGLTAGTTYWCTVQTIGDGSTYCTQGGIAKVSGTTTAAATLYTVTYDVNGAGSVTPASETAASVTLPTPTWSGYTFEGWYNNGTKIGNGGAPYTPTADITLYAHWTDNISGKVFSFIDNNYGDKFKGFDGETWVTADADGNKTKTYTHGTTGVQFAVTNGSWDKKNNAISSLAKFKSETTSMSVVVPAGKIATVKISYGAYNTGNQLTVNSTNQTAPSTALTDGMTNAQVFAALKEITLNNQTGTLTLGSSTGNIYIGRVSATITGYTVTYAKGSADGASGDTFTGTKTAGSSFTLSSSSSAFTRDGYTYDGWSTNEDGSTKDYNLGGSYTTDAPVTLYPHWVAVCSGPNGGSATYTAGGYTYEQGDDANTMSLTGMAASNGGALSYQWYKTTSDYAAGEAIDGATSNTYTPSTAVVHAAKWYYFCVVTEAGCATTYRSALSGAIDVNPAVCFNLTLKTDGSAGSVATGTAITTSNYASTLTGGVARVGGSKSPTAYSAGADGGLTLDDNGRQIDVDLDYLTQVGSIITVKFYLSGSGTNYGIKINGQAKWTVSSSSGSQTLSYTLTGSDTELIGKSHLTIARNAGSPVFLSITVANCSGTEAPCFSISDAGKNGSTTLSADTVTNAIIDGTIRGGQVKWTGGSYDANDADGIIFNADDDEITITLWGDKALDEGSVISITQHGNSSTGKATGFKISGNSMSPATYTNSSAKEENTQTYTVPEGSALIGKQSFTIKWTGSNQVYLKAMNITGCGEYSCTAPTSPSIAISDNDGDNDYHLSSSELTFTASATDTDGSTTYTWYRCQTADDIATTKASGTPIQAASTSTTYTISFLKDGNLAAGGDEAIYLCKISNGTGCDVWAQTSLDVTPAASVSITYHLNGASWVGGYTAPSSYRPGAEGATLPIASNMTNTGYTFGGWYDNSGLTGSAVTEITTSDYGDKEYWAKWTENTYTITYDKNGGTGSDMSTTVGHYVTLSNNSYTAPSGKIFAEWNTAPDGSGASHSEGEEIELTADMTLYAQWGTDLTATWSVTKVDDKLYRGGGGYSVTVYLDDAEWDASGDVTALELTATEGVVLSNITKTVNGEGQAQVTANFGITTGVAADATAITFTLSVPAAGTYASVDLPHNETLDDCSGSGGTVSIFDGTIDNTNTKDAIKYKQDKKWTDPTTSFASTAVGVKDPLYVFADNSWSTSNVTVSGKKYLRGIQQGGSNAAENHFKLEIPTGTTATIYFVGGNTGGAPLFGLNKSAIAPQSGTHADKVWYGEHGSSKVLRGWTIENIPSGTYYLVGNNGNCIFAEVTVTLTPLGGGGSGPVTPTLNWETDLSGGVSKKTSDDDFVHTASQDMNSLGAITYSSNNTAVATVNATTGEVHLEGAGTATITATIAASGCYNTASVSYVVTVEDDCDDVAGTITTEDLGCSGIKMTVTGHTTTASTSYQWYKVGSPDEFVGTDQDNFTTSDAGSYYVIVTNTGNRHCAKRSRNTIEVEAQSVATATKIVDSWYVKNGRRTPDVELVQTTNANGFIVKIGDTPIWNSDGSETTGFGGCGFHLGENGIIYLNGTTAEDGSGDAPSGLTGDGGTEVLKITAKGCGGDAAELSITIHKQVPAEGARPSIAFVVDGTEKGTFAQANASHSTNSALFKFLDYGDDSNGAFDLTAQNIYSTTDEKTIREHYSQFDAIIITDDPNTKKNPENKNGDYYKNHSYVNAFGTMIDVRPILSMEAFVSRLANWSAKGVAGDPSSPNPRPYEMRLQCKDHEIYTGLPTPAPGTHVWIETIDDEEYRHVVMVDKTKSPYTGLADNEKTSGEGEVPALQGFAASAMGDLLGLGVISEGALQAAIERQEEPAARMMLLGVNAKALPNALTEEGKKVIENALKYLLKTNMEEVDDCSNFFKGGDPTNPRDWNTAANWAKSTLPNYETKVRILAPCEVSGIHVRVAQVDIATSGTSSKIPSGTCSGSLTIKEDGALIVGGKVRTAEAPRFAANDLKPTTPEDLIILSNESGTGALIFDNSDGKAQATVQMYSASYWETEAGKKKKYWSYVGVPIADVEIPDYFYLGFTYLYDETSGWIKKWDGSVLQPFEGIGLSMQAGHMETFRGTLASTKTKEITLTKTAEGGNGENLIGNSWTAPIQIANFETADFGGATAAVYVYNTGRDDVYQNPTVVIADEGNDGAATAGQWVGVPIGVAGLSGYTGLKVIPAMNAFQVNTTSEATLTLDYDKLVRKNAASNAQINNPLRAPRRDVPNEVEALMRVRVSGEKTHTDVWLLQDERFSDGFDNGWEVTYAECDNRSAQLYAVSELGQMAFIAKPDLEGTPIGFAPSRDGNVYTFSFQYTGGDTYYLNDLKEEKSTLIEAENTYLFTYEEGEMSPRFLISTTPFESPSVTTGVGNVGHSEKAQKIIYNDHVYIIRGGKIYDVMGKMMK